MINSAFEERNKLIPLQFITQCTCVATYHYTSMHEYNSLFIIAYYLTFFEHINTSENTKFCVSLEIPIFQLSSN